eukprot:g7243.t1
MFGPRVTLVPVLTVAIGLKMDALAINLVQYSSPASLKLRHRGRTSNESNRTRRVEKLNNRLNNPLQFHSIDPGSTTDEKEERASPTFLAYAQDQLSSLERKKPNGILKTSNMELDVRPGSKGVNRSKASQQPIRFDVQPGVFYKNNGLKGSNPNLEALTVGSNGLMKSASTINFLQFKLDEQMTNKMKARSIKKLKHMNSPPSPTRRGKTKLTPTIPLGKIVVPMMDGIESIVDDGFQKCFERRSEPSWNYVWYLAIPWFFGLLFRWFVLFPVRLIYWITGHILFIILNILGSIYFTYTRNHDKQKKFELYLVKWLAYIYVSSWSGVVRFHGEKPRLQKQVFVANHSTMIDVAILLQNNIYSLVGQAHSSYYVNIVQNVAMRSMDCIWFNRDENRDRAKVSRRLREHARNSNGDLQPLLIFPEGTCVNNEYVVLFKKTVFDLDDDIAICPIAIKYNKLFCDAYWISRQESFVFYLFRLMRSYCLVCDVWYMNPMYRKEGESAIEFAGRVQQAIADKAGLKNTQYDGYMKYWKPSLRYKRARQLAFANEILPPSFLTGK